MKHNATDLRLLAPVLLKSAWCIEFHAHIFVEGLAGGFLSREVGVADSLRLRCRMGA